MKNQNYEFKKDRPLSWSSLSCFDDKEWGSPHKWYEKYVRGIKEPPTPELLFGGKIDKQIQKDPTFLPDLERFPFMQYTLEADYKGIPLIGYVDHWDPYPNLKRLADDKTGKNPWTQKKADETGQLTMYAMMLYLTEGINPKDIEFYIRWLPTEQKKDFTIGLVDPLEVQIFKTKRTLPDVLKFMARVERVWKEMQEYVDKNNE